MGSEDYPENQDRGNSGLLKSFAIYLVIFGFGFLAASFSGGVKDSVKGTANLAADTAKETFSVSGFGGGEFVPLKSGSAKNTATQKPIVYKVKPNLPVVVPEEVIVKEESSGSVATGTPQIVSAENSSSTVSSSPVVAVPLSSTQTSQTEQPQNNSEQVGNIKFSLLIYEIRVTGGTGKSNEDYIKIFNPNSKMVDLSGWRLKKGSKTGSESSIRVFPDGITVGAGKVITWANNDYASVVGAELMSSQTIAANNSVGLFNKDGILIDAIGWGEVVGGFVEGSAYPVNPVDGQVLLRKQSGGLLVDTQNNSVDFEIY